MNSSVADYNFTRWEQALLTRNPKNVAELYAENAILLPTIAREVIADKKGIEKYFTFFDTFLPSVSMVTEHVIDMAEESYVHCGVYRFKLTMQRKEQEVDARFSMLWKKIDGEWKICHHHSSRIPIV